MEQNGSGNLPDKFTISGLTFDDVLIAPRYSSVVPSEMDVQTRRTSRIAMNVPVLSSRRYARPEVASLDLAIVRRYLTNMTTTVSSKGQVVLPAELRELDRIVPGQQFSIERVEAGEYLLKKVQIPAKAGLTKWLLDCPERGWFQPLPSESTDTLSAGKL